jgi:hypothetical protein
MHGASNAFTRNARQAQSLVGKYTLCGRLAPGGVVRSIFRFAFVVVPTAVLAAAVVFGASRSGQVSAVTSDGDLQRDLNLASATSLELAPVGQALATVSSIEAPPPATPERTVRPKRSSNGSRAVRSRAPVVRAAPEPEVAEAPEESEASAATELADATEATAEAPAVGGVALPRPTAIPVIIPTSGGGGTYDPGPGSVIRGGVLDDDHCQIYGRGRRTPPIYRQPRGATLGDRIRGATQAGRERTTSLGDRVRGAQASGGSRGSSLGDRVRASQGRTSVSSSGSSSSRGSLGDRIRSARR